VLFAKDIQFDQFVFAAFEQKLASPSRGTWLSACKLADNDRALVGEAQNKSSPIGRGHHGDFLR